MKRKASIFDVQLWIYFFDIISARFNLKKTVRFQQILHTIGIRIKMQQNGFSKDLKTDSGLRQLPLQKSLLLPDNMGHSSSPNPRSNPLQFSIYTPTKRYLTNTNQSASTINSSASLHQNNFTFNQGPLNFHQNNLIGSIYQSRISSQTEPAHQSYTLKSLLSPYKNGPKSQASLEDYHRFSLKNEKSSLNNNEVKVSLTKNVHNQTVIQQVLNQIKDKHLPNIIAKFKKEVYDDIYNVRMQFNSFRQQIRTAVKKQDGQIHQLKANHQTSTNTNMNNNIHLLYPRQKNEKEEQLNQLHTHYFLLQGKMTQFQTRFAENTKMIFQELKQFNQKFESQYKLNQLRPSLIKSSFAPIILEYRQLFTVKKGQNNVSSKEEQEQIILNHCIYFIDKQGFLMDSQNRYIIDYKGTQIRLQDKHLKMLEGYKILQR